MQHKLTEDAPVVIIGGGLAGLTAAVTLARAGAPVHLFEQSKRLGGRATSQQKQGFVFNQGPHALYVGGAGQRELRELGIPVHGGKPPTAGYAVAQGQRQRLPSAPLDILRTRLLSGPDKLRCMALFVRLLSTNSATLQSISTRQWVERTTSRPVLRQLLYAFLRVSTYDNQSDCQSAGAALAQLQLAARQSVLYLDGGWQSLVDALGEAACAAGVQMTTDAAVEAVEFVDGTAAGVRLRDGTLQRAAAVVMAADPATVRELTQAGGIDVSGWLPQMPPIYAACLDVALARLPNPDKCVALGVDTPLYLSVHSASARLAPAGGALIHVAKYLTDADVNGDPEVDKAELLALLDLVQPGWCEQVVEQRFLPRMKVANARVTAAGGGLAGRPGPAVAKVDGLYVAGGWVGPEGMLADASLASARRAAEMILSHEQS